MLKHLTKTCVTHVAGQIPHLVIFTFLHYSRSGHRSGTSNAGTWQPGIILGFSVDAKRHSPVFSFLFFSQMLVCAEEPPPEEGNPIQGGRQGAAGGLR